MAKKIEDRNNYGCFTGIGLAYWRELARGLQPSLVRDRMGTRLEYATDSGEGQDGLSTNNGGIIAPQVGYLERGNLYFRFYSAHAHNTRPGKGWHGNWWVSQSVFSALKGEALDSGASLREVASRRLALPLSWNDIRYVVCATPRTNLKTWYGRGKVAHPTMSPASAARARPWEKDAKDEKVLAKNLEDEGGLYGDAPEMSLHQLFVPGDARAGVFDDYFQALGTGRVFDREALEINFGGGLDKVKWPGAKRGATHA